MSQMKELVRQVAIKLAQKAPDNVIEEWKEKGFLPDNFERVSKNSD